MHMHGSLGGAGGATSYCAVSAAVAVLCLCGTAVASTPHTGGHTGTSGAPRSPTVTFGEPVLVGVGAPMVREDVSEYAAVTAADTAAAGTVIMGSIDGKMVTDGGSGGKQWARNNALHAPPVVFPAPPGVGQAGAAYSFGSISSAFVNATTEFTSTYTDEFSALPGGSGVNITRRAQAVHVTGLPKPVISIRFSSGDVKLTSLGVLASAVVWFADAPPPERDLQCCALAIVLLRQSPSGFEWEYMSTIANHTYLNSTEGPNENALVQLKDGTLLCIMRIDGGDGPTHAHRPYAIAHSGDGKSWSRSPLSAQVGSARPRAQVLANGAIVLSGGRPLLNLWVSADGSGDPGSWTTFNIASEHNAREANDTLKFCSEFASGTAHDWTQSTCYTSVVSAVPASNTITLIYDRYGRGSGGYSGTMPPDCQGTQAAVFAMEVTVEL